MKKSFLLFASIFLFTFFLRAQDISYNHQEYQNRIDKYRQENFNNDEISSIPLQAFLKQPVDPTALQNIIDKVNTSGEFDFNLVQLIRVLFLSNGQYEDQLLPAIHSIPLWLAPNENLRVYWSENHITMWLSSQWLLHEKYGWEVDEDLRAKMIHCLDLKINYGYYEFFSSTYFPYTLSGLLNLVDFSQDEEIRNKAILATNRLLKEVLTVVNEKGVFFPAAGRNYLGKYQTAYGQNHNDIIYLLTGLGKANGRSHAAAFLATSTIDVKDIVNSWKEKENTILTMGQPLSQTNTLHQGFSSLDKTIFQWSAGIYLHPDFAKESVTLLNDYNLWNHKEFKTFSLFKGLPAQIAPGLAQFAGSISRSSVLTDAKIAIYKNKSITLSSIQNYWKGRSGYQQWPWAANTGTTAVFTQSGVSNNPFVKESQNANSNLPYIQQVDNLALIMYRPNKDLSLFGLDNHDVALFWQDSLYDEVTEYGKWIIAREGDSYIGVLRHCTDQVNGIYGCDDQDGQLWACIVGNEEMYGSFDQFVQKIQKSKYQEKWTLDLKKFEWHYYGMVEVDGNKIEYDWIGDLLSVPKDDKTDPLVTSTRNILESNSISIYPNPTKTEFTLNWNRPEALKNVVLNIYDMSGKVVTSQLIDVLPNYKIRVPLKGIPSGIYQVILNTEIGIVAEKLIVL
ncbi:MAG TPA: T9SS type A sorting domain-containing protein [Chitinophagales bacterium]|nr:T9SS type A sorting domain-containing protein [Chitinophagales bacterium]